MNWGMMFWLVLAGVLLTIAISAAPRQPRQSAAEQPALSDEDRRKKEADEAAALVQQNNLTIQLLMMPR